MKIDIGKRTIYHGIDGSEAVVSDGVIFIKDAQGNGDPFFNLETAHGRKAYELWQKLKGERV